MNHLFSCIHVARVAALKDENIQQNKSLSFIFTFIHSWSLNYYVWRFNRHFQVKNVKIKLRLLFWWMFSSFYEWRLLRYYSWHGKSSEDNVYDGRSQKVISLSPPINEIFNRLKWTARFTGVFVHDPEMTKNRFSRMFFKLLNNRRAPLR